MIGYMKKISYVSLPGLGNSDETSKEVVYRSCHQVATKVCELYGITLDMITSRRRFRHIMLPKQIYCYMCKKYIIPRPTLKSIGDFINVGHATVLHSIKSVNNLMDTDSEFKLVMKSIDRKFKQTNIQYNE